MSTGTPIDVPWRVLPDYRCFGCSPSNEHGLRLNFTHSGDGIECVLRVDRTFESYPGVVHGGIATTVCDEIMGNLLVLKVGTSVFTTTLRTRYLSPLAVGVEYRCVATADAVDSPPYRAYAEITDPDGATCVTAVGTYQPATPAQARERMDLTDTEADLIESALADLRRGQ
ncbi:hotdog domain-containing protein [Actinokineospora globicatena]|uniref:Acyl-coenzyme A thioesterase THEM4 n=1 Tax=Actinokineospora globicatena TaxID=103729 RepID=A0A9W6QES0_9PSEU|nr:hotdog domain-containing protein [Actinokineospora globicatena]MCP2303888.1 Acyl-coenzyme A thioesterase PaaI, contains HGG motif [Actinokineospora globicatena]GLW78954.1 thioesterase [Actinokineospora globicatena]GLW86635.1 thioesterase [Actinokineospora globicatena]GLW89596.1 thioesterase [Actinokineospora globicatena]